MTKVYTQTPIKDTDTKNNQENNSQASVVTSFSVPKAAPAPGDLFNPHIRNKNEKAKGHTEYQDYENWVNQCFKEWESWLVSKELRLANLSPNLNPNRKYKPTNFD